jgi:hypothetical protein
MEAETVIPSYSEEVLEGRVVVNVGPYGRRGRTHISIGTLGNRHGSMTLTPLELAALLDGPLERALEEATKE